MSTNSVGLSSGGKDDNDNDQIEHIEQKDFAFAESIANSMGAFSLTPSKDNEKSPGEEKKN